MKVFEKVGQNHLRRPEQYSRTSSSARALEGGQS